VAVGAVLHCGQQMRPGFERKSDEDPGRRNMVFEGGTAFGRQRAARAMQMASKPAFVVAGNPIAQDQIVHATADIDGIHLHVTEVGKGRSDCGNGPIKQERPPLEATSNCRTDTDGAKHRVSAEIRLLARKPASPLVAPAKSRA
jgi:hypothetical protein